MKILLKKEVCGSRKQYTEPTKKTLCLLKRASQKKKERKTQTLGINSSIQTGIKTYLD